MENTQEKSYPHFQFSIKSLFIFDPTLQPKMKKPNEQDIQDAQLLFYFPLNSTLNEKRNHVGMGQGTYGYWDFNLQSQRKTPDNKQTWLEKIAKLAEQKTSDGSSNTGADTGGNNQAPPTEKPKEQTKNNVEESKQLNPNPEFGELQQQIPTQQEPTDREILHNDEYQVIFTKRFIHCVKKIEKDLWIYIVLQQELSEDIEFGTDSKEDPQAYYYSPQNNTYSEYYYTENGVLDFVKHFYSNFFTFYGPMRDYLIDDETRKQSETIFTEYISRYIILNSEKSKLNILNYQFSTYGYAPIQRSIFLQLQYLVSILSSLDSNISHFSIINNGYTIYSTLPNDSTLAMHDYFYKSSIPFQNDDIQITSKFVLLNQIEVKDHLYGLYFNSTLLGEKTNLVTGYSNNNGNTLKSQQSEVISTESRILSQLTESSTPIYQPSKVTENHDLEIQEDVVKLQKVYFCIGGKTVKLQMNINFHDQQLLLLMFYKEDQIVYQNQIMEINAAISQNIDKISVKIEENVKQSLQSEEAYQFMYLNGMNLASQFTSGLIRDSFLLNNSLILRKTFEFLKQSDSHVANQLVYVDEAWIYGIKSMDRILIIIFPALLTLPRVKEEAEKVCKSYFANFFIF